MKFVLFVAAIVSAILAVNINDTIAATCVGLLAALFAVNGLTYTRMVRGY